MPDRQIDHFQEDALSRLFESRIVKSRAVGLDGTRLEHFTEILASEAALIERKVTSLNYNFTSFREKLILKGANRYPRQISIPTVRDRLTLRAVCNAVAETVPQARSSPPHSYIKNIAAEIKASSEPCSFLRVDVRDFFPTIQHERLLEQLLSHGIEDFLSNLISKAIKNKTGANSSARNDDIGVPQGLSISNILSSVYMLELDAAQTKIGGYHRYVDDILVIAPSHLITARYRQLHTSLMAIGLTPHTMGVAGKTEIKRVVEGIDYLGYHLTPSNISVRASSYNRMFANLSKVFTLYKYRKNLNQFILKLNLRITGCIVDGKRKGWLMFFSQTDDLSQLKYLDDFVTKQCKKYNVNSLDVHVSRFIKSYHEIRFKGVDSEYIPNFDQYTLEKQYELINMLTGTSVEELSSRSIEDTDRVFKELVAHEVTDLEIDVMNAVS